jgi:hypothetical protein
MDFKRGQTFDFSGQLMNGTVPYPLGGYSLRADLRSRTGFSLVQALTTQIVDAPTAVVRISATAQQTARWKLMPHILDLRLVDGAGNVILSRTEEINVLAQVTQ